MAETIPAKQKAVSVLFVHDPLLEFGGLGVFRRPRTAWSLRDRGSTDSEKPGHAQRSEDVLTRLMM